MALFEEYRFTIILIVLTPILIFATMLSTGGGHLTSPFFVLFPWGMIGTVFEDTVSFLFISTGILQFPTYGFLLDWWGKNKRVAVFSILILQHTVLATILLLTRS